MTCTSTNGIHAFFEIKKLAQYVDGAPSFRTAKEGVLVVCAHCGQVREAWESGEIVVRQANENSTKAGTPGTH
jgi:hypothetical protein